VRGGNGAGKTSLLEVLCGLREPAEGAVQLGVEPDQCHWIGHRNGINAALTPAENLRFWCSVQDASPGGVDAALDRFALRAVAGRPSRQLSAGQKRRLALARLVLADRPLWFLDEPLSSLDRDGVERWAGLLRYHQAAGGAAVITSHQALPVELPGLKTLELG